MIFQLLTINNGLQCTTYGCYPARPTLEGWTPSLLLNCCCGPALGPSCWTTIWQKERAALRLICRLLLKAQVLQTQLTLKLQGTELWTEGFIMRPGYIDSADHSFFSRCHKAFNIIKIQNTHIWVSAGVWSWGGWTVGAELWKGRSCVFPAVWCMAAPENWG